MAVEEANGGEFARINAGLMIKSHDSDAFELLFDLVRIGGFLLKVLWWLMAVLLVELVLENFWELRRL